MKVSRNNFTFIPIGVTLQKCDKETRQPAPVYFGEVVDVYERTDPNDPQTHPIPEFVRSKDPGPQHEDTRTRDGV